MKRPEIALLFILLLPAFMSNCSEDFLEIYPGNFINEHLLANEKGIDMLLVGAYSMLDGATGDLGGFTATTSNWLFGSIRGVEANKGTDAGDSWEGTPIMNFQEDFRNSLLNEKWKVIYESISRCNNVVRVADLALKEGNITGNQSDLFIRQARGLRGFYHFEAWRMWKKIPYLDEDADTSDYGNKTDNSDKIISDLKAGSELPDNMGAVGRFNGTVCKVLLAKATMQINHDYKVALTLLEDAISGSKPDGTPIGLSPKFGDIFDIENRNGIEAVYTIQTSVNDGSGGLNGGYGEVLNFPYKPNGGSPAGCCGFFQPTQELVNSFRTVDGLPLLDNSYNSSSEQVLRDQGIPGGDLWDPGKVYGIYTGNYNFPANPACTVYDPSRPFTDLAYVSLKNDNIGNNPLTSPDFWQLVWTEDNTRSIDPRLDWTAGRRGIPYWDWGVHTGSDWIRDQQYAGPYSPKKMVYRKSQQDVYTEQNSWTTGFTANGYRLVRFADILLLIAECQIETGDLEGARRNINLIRARAANPDGFVKESDGITNAANYSIREYPAGVFPFDSKENARLALRMERKLELALEGHRWFDLNRWDIAVDEANRILGYERTMPWGKALYGSAAASPDDEWYPIPEQQIILSNKRLVQNR